MSDPDRTHAPLLITGSVERPIELVQRSGPLSPLLTLVQPMPGADHATVVSRDGQFRASIPLAWLRRGRLDSGRLHIPSTPTRCWLVRDVVAIQVTIGARPDSVPAGAVPAGAVTDGPGTMPGTAGAGS